LENVSLWIVLIEGCDSMNHYKLFPKFWCTFVICVFLSFGNAYANQIDPGKINEAYLQLAASPQMENGLVSLTVIDARTGELIFSENGKVGMAPASTLKNITAATAFRVLGEDFRFKTKVLIKGRVDEEGVLHGDLIVQGSGDPSLGSERYEETKETLILEKWIQALKDRGIKTINGRILANDLLFGGNQAPGGWPWADMGNYYGAGVSALNWRENSFGVVFRPGSNPGDLAKIQSTSVDVSYLDIVNEVTTGRRGSGDNVYAYSAPYSNRVFFRGTHGADLKKTISMSLPDPAYDLVYQLSRKLEEVGINHKKPVATVYSLQSTGEGFVLEDDRDIEVLDVHESPVLSELIYWFNRSSINLYGESLLKAMAHKLGEETGTADAASWMARYWSEALGIPVGELRIADGSGLSPNNRITTHAMSRILLACREEPWFEDFYESLPVNNGMKIKSGTIGGVLGYAGYHTSSLGIPLVFTILVSNYQGGAQAMRNQMFRLLDSLK